jgi:hypothetical protein
MKRRLIVASLFFLLSIPALAADQSLEELRRTVGEAVFPFIELDDAPSITVDWRKATVQSVTLHGNRTFTFINGHKGGRYVLIIKQDATGSRTVTWPASVHWPGDSPQPPTLTTTANKKDYINFFYDGAIYDLVAMSQGL